MSLGLTYSPIATKLTMATGKLSATEATRLLAVVLDIGLARQETETITVSTTVLQHLRLLETIEPDFVLLWSLADQVEFTYLVEHPGQVGEYRGYPLLLDATLDKDAPIVLNGVIEGQSMFVNVDL